MSTLLHPPPPTHNANTIQPTPDHGVPGEAIAEAFDAFEKGQNVSPLAAAAVSNQTIQESMKLVLLVRAFQVRCCWCLCGLDVGSSVGFCVQLARVFRQKQQQRCQTSVCGCCVGVNSQVRVCVVTYPLAVS